MLQTHHMSQVHFSVFFPSVQTFCFLRTSSQPQNQPGLFLEHLCKAIKHHYNIPVFINLTTNRNDVYHILKICGQVYHMKCTYFSKSLFLKQKKAVSWASRGRTRAAQCISSSVTEAPVGYSRTQSNSEVSGTTYLSGTQPYLSPSIPMKRWRFEASSKHNSKVLYKGNDAHILKWIKTVINLFICGLFCDKYCKVMRQILINYTYLLLVASSSVTPHLKSTSQTLMKCFVAMALSCGKTNRVSKSRSPCMSRNVEDMNTRTVRHL